MLHGASGGVRRLPVKCPSPIATVGTPKPPLCHKVGPRQRKAIADELPKSDRDLRNHQPVEMSHGVSGGARATGGSMLKSAEVIKRAKNPLSGSAAKSVEVAEARLSRAIARD